MVCRCCPACAVPTDHFGTADDPVVLCYPRLGCVRHNVHRLPRPDRHAGAAWASDAGYSARSPEDPRCSCASCRRNRVVSGGSGRWAGDAGRRAGAVVDAVAVAVAHLCRGNGGGHHRPRWRADSAAGDTFFGGVVLLVDRTVDHPRRSRLGGLAAGLRPLCGAVHRLCHRRHCQCAEHHRRGAWPGVRHGDADAVGPCGVGLAVGRRRAPGLYSGVDLAAGRVLRAEFPLWAHFHGRCRGGDGGLLAGNGRRGAAAAQPRNLAAGRADRAGLPGDGNAGLDHPPPAEKGRQSRHR